MSHRGRERRETETDSNTTSASGIKIQLFGMLLMLMVFAAFAVFGLFVIQKWRNQSALEHHTIAYAKMTEQVSAATKATPTPKAAKKRQNEENADLIPNLRYDFYQQLPEQRGQINAQIADKVGTPPAQEVGGAHYRIQVGAFRTQTQAERMRARMILRDYPTTISRSSRFYLVQIGPYKDKQDALRVQKQLAHEGIATMLKSYVD